MLILDRKGLFSVCVLAMGAVSVTVEVSSGMGSDVRGRRDNSYIGVLLEVTSQGCV